VYFRINWGEGASCLGNGGVKYLNKVYCRINCGKGLHVSGNGVKYLFKVYCRINWGEVAS
jgi:hypothetical protein